MSCKVVQFDNGYKYYLDSEYLTDSNGVYVAGFYNLIRELSLNPKEMSDAQLFALCEPMIQAYKLGIERAERKMTEKVLKIFDLKKEATE